MSQRTNWLCLLIGFLLFAVFAFYFFSYAPDDIWISLRYADNLANGHGLAFNPGEKVEGYSNFLWVMEMFLFAGGAGKMGLTWAAKVLGILFGLGSLLLVSNVARRQAPMEGAEAYWGLAPLAYGLSVFPAFWSASGMEIGFYLLWIVFAAGSYIYYIRSGKAVWAVMAGIGFLAVALTRPEGILFFVAAASVEGSFRLRDKKDSSNVIFAVGVAVAIAYGAFFLWRHAYFGQWWPNTFYAKAGGGLAKYVEGVRYLLLNLPNLFWGNPLLLALFALPFLRPRSIGRPVAFLGLCIILQSAFVLFAGGDWMPGSRFLVPVMPIIALLVPVVIVDVRKRLVTSERISTLAAALLALIVTGSALMHIYNAKQVHHNPQGKAYHIGNFYKPDHYAVAMWLKQNAGAGDLVAVGEAGLIPYLTDLPALDLFGLMDPYLARLPGLRHEKFDVDYCFEKQPAYIVLGGCRIWNDKVTSDFAYARALLADERLEWNYRRVYTYHTFIVYEAR